MKKLFCFVYACVLALGIQAADINNYDALYENLPFKMEKVTRPQFPSNEVNLKDFGAMVMVLPSAPMHSGKPSMPWPRKVAANSSYLRAYGSPVLSP